ncbi:hypothetical protein [Candidimonas nitroreducens]|uniref:Uncharacterized protein n=1 Tax=Candidimonas nitroreducens TaxID=683354 RepID=A0A225MFT1_9BURK|nr:hypothetical protein [Candidimonas nitroreducens]OWT60058.1 hypothetical protein CEY11_10295 [Candidimonas nitroreducens]
MTLCGFAAGIVLVLLAGVAARGATPAAPAAAPVPWLVIDPNGGYGMARYGYRDTAGGKMAIAAIWADAQPFKNGYAVVGKRLSADGRVRSVRYGATAGRKFPVRRYGLIDIAPDKPITPPIYDFIDTDGRVGQSCQIVNGYGVKLDRGFSYYLDRRTGEPFVGESKKRNPMLHRIPLTVQMAACLGKQHF